MKTYIVSLDFPMNFYPPLSKEEVSTLLNEHLFVPVRTQAATTNSEIVIKEELNLIGKIIVDASEKSAKTLRGLGFHLQLKKIQ